MAIHVAEQATTDTGWPAVSGGEPILAAKVTAPCVPGWAVHRPRITRLIVQGTRCCPLTFITGPPGAGKTTALALWAAAASGTVAWFSLDEYDNQPGVFWSYVVAALRLSGPAVPGALLAAIRGRAGDQAFLPRLASALAAQNPPVMLVVDDLDLLTDRQVLTELDYVLRNAGPGLRLVVSSRMDPLPLLHRYRLAGNLAEIRASDLAFSTAEAGLLMVQHGITLPAEPLKCLTQRTEGWAAGLRLAAISAGTHHDLGQFVKDLAVEDSAVADYLVKEVFNAQPPEVRDTLLCTSILERVSAEAASELTGNEQAGGILLSLARANAFVLPTGHGWYRYHTLFAEVLRLKLSREHPDRIGPLHRRAALWYERRGALGDAVRHAAQASDWQLAARMVIDGLAISEIIEPRGSQSPADEFRNMPHDQAWAEPQPYLVSAAVALSAGQYESSAAAVSLAEGILNRLPANQEAACQLAAVMIRFAAARRTGAHSAVAEAAARAEVLVGRIPGGKLARHPEIRARVLLVRGAADLWSGHLDEAAHVLDSGLAAAASGVDHERADYHGHLALVEALRGRLRRAAELASRATAVLAPDERPIAWHPNPPALVALAWMHLEHHELREAASRLKQANAALGAHPDRLIQAVASLTAACGALAEGHAGVAAHITARARAGWPIPAWLEQRLSLVESRASAAAGDTQAALAAAERAARDNSPEAAVTLAHAWLAAGDSGNARRALAPALAAHSGTPERVRLQVWLADARLNYNTGDSARGRRSLASALRLAGREQLRLPFAVERSWLGPTLRRDSGLADIYRRLFASGLYRDQLPAPPAVQNQATTLAAQPLTEREREVLRHFSNMLSSAEVATEMLISINTVNTHLKHILRKLAASRRGEAVRRARQLGLI